MEKIEECLVGKIPLEEREKFLFETMDEIDKESYHLYSDIIDLKQESSFRIESLNRRENALNKLFLKAKEAFYYLSSLEAFNRSFAIRRHQTKTLLTIITSYYASLVNPALGIASFYVLLRMNNNYLAYELGSIDEAIEQYDIDDQLNLIQITLDNCESLLKKKSAKVEAKSLEFSQDKQRRMKAITELIVAFMSGELTKEEILGLPDSMKKQIEVILRKDREEEDKTLEELLDSLLQEEESHKKLLNRFNPE